MPIALPEQKLVNLEKLASICRESGVRSLALFGSFLHGDAQPDSDVDLLVEFEPGRRVTLFDLARLESDITDLLGRPVDLRTVEELSPYFRQDVTAEAQVVYAKG